MAHIDLPEGAPGIVGPLIQYPKTGEPLLALAQTLLRGPSPLAPEERELIAAYVSTRNGCVFCATSHAEAARHLYAGRDEIVGQVLADLDSAPVDGRLRSLLVLAGRVCDGGLAVGDADVAAARAAGADDQAIHDTVLVAAAFCMYNRYVDGLATSAPEDPAAYEAMGAELARDGYVAP